MSSKVSFRNVRALTHELSQICEGILFRGGPFLKEGIYQDLLVHELDLQGILSSREFVFNYQFKDSQGNDFLLGNNQCLRSDLELPLMAGILELKSTTNITKMESLWQLRNYLEQRPDRSWGTIINFTSKFGPKTSPKVQCDTLYKVSQFSDVDQTLMVDDDLFFSGTYCVNRGDGSEAPINRYYSERIMSRGYPEENKVFSTLSSANDEDDGDVKEK